MSVLGLRLVSRRMVPVIQGCNMLLFDALLDVLYQGSMSSFRRFALNGENGKGVARKPFTMVRISSGSRLMIDCSVLLLLVLQGDVMDSSISREASETGERIAVSSVAFCVVVFRINASLCCFAASRCRRICSFRTWRRLNSFR